LIFQYLLNWIWSSDGDVSSFIYHEIDEQDDYSDAMVHYRDDYYDVWVLVAYDAYGVYEILTDAFKDALFLCLYY